MAVAFVIFSEIVQIDEENDDLFACPEGIDSPFAQTVAPREAGERIPGSAELFEEHAGGHDSEKLASPHDKRPVDALLDKQFGNLTDWHIRLHHDGWGLH